MPDIILSQIRKTYPTGAVGLHPTDLRIADGECFALLGPSGSGKTTLLRLVAGLERPDGGTLEIGGVRSEAKPPHERGVSLVTQNPALYPHLNVADNLAIALRFEQSNRPRKQRLGGPEIARRTGEAAELLGLAGLLDRRVHELSGGEQRRVALGRAVVARRRVWLLDEPFSQLDTPLKDRLCGELHLLRGRLGITIIHVTHDPNEAMATADRVGVLGEGRLLQAGKPDEVLNRPGHRTVAFCFGWPPMNLIEGRVEDGPTFVAAAGPWRIPLTIKVSEGAGVTLGVRPDDVHAGGVPGWVPAGAGEVVGTQPLAGRVLATVRVGGLLLKTLGEAATVGGRVEVWVSPAGLHVYDRESGRRLE